MGKLKLSKQNFVSKPLVPAEPKFVTRCTKKSRPRLQQLSKTRRYSSSNNYITKPSTEPCRKAPPVVKGIMMLLQDLDIVESERYGSLSSTGTETA
jgi:hypothetical protein